MVVVPGPTPVTSPAVPMVAALVLLLLHVPPLVASVKVVVEPAQSEVSPETDDKGFIVTGWVVLHPVAVSV